MNTAHLHLLLNHFPIVGTMVMGVVLIIGYLRKDTGIKKVSFALLFALAIVGFAAYQTGESAEEAVENLQGINEWALEEHEDFAKIANILNIITGIFSAISFYLVLKGKSMIKYIGIVTLLLVFATIGTMSYTGYLGGQIRHTEFNSGSTQNAGEGSSKTNVEHDND